MRLVHVLGKLEVGAVVFGVERTRDVINAMTEMMGDDMRQEISRIKAPTLVLGSWIAYKDYGTKPLFEQMYKSQYQQLPGVKVELADNARHFIMYDDPAWMYDRIDNFLK